MGEYWYFLEVEAESYSRIWVLVDSPKKTGQRIELIDTLGYIERINNGEWLCFVREYRRRTVKCIGGEPSAHSAKRTVILYVRGALALRRSST